MIKPEFIAVIYIIVVLVIYSVGIDALFETDAGLRFKRLRVKGRLYTRLNLNQKGYWDDFILAKLLEDQFETTRGRKQFIIITTLSTVIVLFFGAIALPPLYAFGLAALTIAFPWAVLWMRKTIAGNKGSFEGETLISLLLSRYRIENYNIMEALEAVVKDGKDIPYSAKHISRFLLNARQGSSGTSLTEATKQLAEALNTNWGKMLASDIHIAVTSGRNIALALEEILKQLREAGSLYEDRKRMNSETVRLSLFMLPVTYGLTFWMSVKFMNMSISTILFNQFRTPTGVMMLTGMILLFFLNWALIELVKHQKFDY